MIVPPKIYLWLKQRCFICDKTVWFFQKWYPTYDNYVYHYVCIYTWMRVKKYEERYSEAPKTDRSLSGRDC